MGRVGDAVERRVGAEVDDPPAAPAQREPEGDQAEVVLLARCAGEQRHAGRGRGPSRARGRAGGPAGRTTRSAPGRPTPRRAPSARRDRAGTGRRPRAAAVDASPREQRVERPSARARSSNVEQCVRELDLRVGRAATAPACRFAELRRERGGLGCGETLRKVLLHRPHALEVVRRVEAQPAGGARRRSRP